MAKPIRFTVDRDPYGNRSYRACGYTIFKDDSFSTSRRSVWMVLQEQARHLAPPDHVLLKPWYGSLNVAKAAVRRMCAR